MPSLQALETFRSSFSRLGGELATLEELELAPDMFPLPDTEPVANPGGEAPRDSAHADSAPDDAAPYDAAPAGGSDIIDFGDLTDLIGGADSPVPDIAGAEDAPLSGQDDIDFGNFIDTIPDDFAADNAAGNTAGNTGDEPAFADADIPADMDVPSGMDIPGMDIPPDLLNGFADEIEAERNSAGDDTALDTDFPAETDFNDNEAFGDEFGDLDLSAPLPADENLSDESLPDESPSGGDSDGGILADFPDFDSGESLELSGEEGPEIASPAPETADAGDAALSDESFPDFDLPAESSGGDDLGGADFAETDFADTDFAETDFGGESLPDMDFSDEVSGGDAELS